MVNLPCLMVSCTNFLRPTCPYTECRLSFLTGSCPTEWTTAGYGSCLFFDFTDLLFTAKDCIFSGRSPLLHPLVLLECSGLHTSFGFRVSFPEPCPVSDFLWNPARVWKFWYCLFLRCLYCLLVRSYYVSQHLLRIVCRPFRQDSKNNPQYLTGNHNQGLHLL